MVALQVGTEAAQGVVTEGNASRLTPEQMVSALRRRTGRQSLRAFVQTYLPGHFRKQPSAMHLELFELLEKSVADRGVRIAVAAPRGNAKTTVISLGFVLYCLVYKLESFIVIASDTADQAIDVLSQIKAELEGNPLLMEDFPEACEQRGLRAPKERWRKDDIITRHSVRVLAIGAGQKVRGRKNRESRPTLVVVDDIENEELVRSEEQRRNRLEWFKSSLSKAGTAQTNFIVAGTVLHSDSLLGNLLDPLKMPGWLTRRYRSVIQWPARMDLWERWQHVYNHSERYEEQSGPTAARRFFAANRAAMIEGTQVLWPEHEPIEELMELRVRDGAASFEREKQNEPAGLENTLFKAADLHYWDDPKEGFSSASFDELLKRLGGCSISMGVDPSLGRQGRHHDDTAIVVVAKEYSSKRMFVLDADIARRKPDEIVERVIALCRLYDVTSVGVESVQFQAMLKSEIERRMWECGLARVYVREIKQTTDKLARFQGIQPHVVAGRILFSQRQVNLVNQLLAVPHGAHDDGPDALEIAVRGAEQPVVRAVATVGGVSL